MAVSFKHKELPEVITKPYLHKLYLKELASTDLLIKSYQKHFDQTLGSSFFHSFHNLSLYSALTNADLSVLLTKYRKAKHSHEKSLFARLIAMTVIEFLDDINTLVGRDLINELSLLYFADFVPIFRDLISDFNKLKNRNEKLLRQIRNNSSAHKSIDSLKFLNMAYDFEMDKIFILGVKVKSISAEMSVELVKVGARLTEFHAEINNLFDRAKKELEADHNG